MTTIRHGFPEFHLYESFINAWFKKDTWTILPNLMKPREMSAYATFLKAGSSKGYEDYNWNVFILFTGQKAELLRVASTQSLIVITDQLQKIIIDSIYAWNKIEQGYQSAIFRIKVWQWMGSGVDVENSEFQMPRRCQFTAMLVTISSSSVNKIEKTIHLKRFNYTQFLIWIFAPKYQFDIF